MRKFGSWYPIDAPIFLVSLRCNCLLERDVQLTKSLFFQQNLEFIPIILNLLDKRKYNIVRKPLFSKPLLKWVGTRCREQFISRLSTQCVVRARSEVNTSAGNSSLARSPQPQRGAAGWSRVQHRVHDPTGQETRRRKNTNGESTRCKSQNARRDIRFRARSFGRF